MSVVAIAKAEIGYTEEGSLMILSTASGMDLTITLGALCLYRGALIEQD